MLSYGMKKDQLIRMQSNTVGLIRNKGTIFQIANDRATEMCKLSPYLMILASM
jgi:hypothetical protein